MSLADMQGKLSRAEMKNIVAGSGSDDDGDCPLNEAACVFAGHSGKAKNKGQDFVCCK